MLLSRLGLLAPGGDEAFRVLQTLLKTPEKELVER